MSLSLLFSMKPVSRGNWILTLPARDLVSLEKNKACLHVETDWTSRYSHWVRSWLLAGAKLIKLQLATSLIINLTRLHLSRECKWPLYWLKWQRLTHYLNGYLTYSLCFSLEDKAREGICFRGGVVRYGGKGVPLQAQAKASLSLWGTSHVMV